MNRSAATDATGLDVQLDQILPWSHDDGDQDPTAAVFAFAPMGEFLRLLRAEMPESEGSVHCFLDDDDDAYVEVAVPDDTSEWELSEKMSAATLQILERTGFYVGLICTVGEVNH